MGYFHGIRMKILVYTSLCVAVISIAGNLFIYDYLSNIISNKTAVLDGLNAQFVATGLNEELEKAWNLVNQCANNTTLVSVTENSVTNNTRNHLNAQQVMNSAIAASGLSEYVNQMILVNSNKDFTIQASNQRFSGTLDDANKVQQNQLFNQLAEDNFSQRFVLSESSLSGNRQVPCLISLVPVSSGPISGATSWLYTEFSLDMLRDVLSTFEYVGQYYISTSDGEILPLGNQPSANSMHQLYESQPNWEFTETALYFDFSLHSAVDSSILQSAQMEITHTVLLALFTSIAAGAGIAVILSSLVSKPIHRLTNRIRRISENDLSFDPTIEQGKDEISQIGRVVNEMTLSVQHLLQETTTQAEQKRKIEIAMLQSQVNPHFLYNTLDSIHWMAVIQKNTGIQQMTRSLSNLLKNMAKGYDQKISLGEELSLLKDYVNIQSIRYLDTFELKNNIPVHFLDYSIIKLTLQPLVENAIFHGIEPTGRFGTITLNGWETETDLFLSVEDDGIGMDEQTIQKALSGASKPSPDSMNGIGVSNVHQRLRLVYGEKYGLHIESEVGKFTRMILHIPKEEASANAVSGSFSG